MAEVHWSQLAQLPRRLRRFERSLPDWPDSFADAFGEGNWWILGDHELINALEIDQTPENEPIVLALEIEGKVPIQGHLLVEFTRFAMGEPSVIRKVGFWDSEGGQVNIFRWANEATEPSPRSWGFKALIGLPTGERLYNWEYEYLAASVLRAMPLDEPRSN